MLLCVCMYVYTYIRMYVRMYVYMHIQAYIHACIHECTYTYVYITLGKLLVFLFASEIVLIKEFVFLPILAGVTWDTLVCTKAYQYVYNIFIN